MANDRTAPGGMGMLLLALLEGRDMYGYEMIEALRARSNEVFRLKAGTLYPLLHSLEAQGWVTSSDGVANGRTRRYYAITRDGRAAQARPAPVVPRFRLSGMGSALGPTIRLPCTVGATSTPLPFWFGHWKMTRPTCVPWLLSIR